MAVEKKTLSAEVLPVVRSKIGRYDVDTFSKAELISTVGRNRYSSYCVKIGPSVSSLSIVFAVKGRKNHEQEGPTFHLVLFVMRVSYGRQRDYEGVAEIRSLLYVLFH